MLHLPVLSNRQRRVQHFHGHSDHGYGHPARLVGSTIAPAEAHSRCHLRYGWVRHRGCHTPSHILFGAIFDILRLHELVLPRSFGCCLCHYLAWNLGFPERDVPDYTAVHKPHAYKTNPFADSRSPPEADGFLAPTKQKQSQSVRL